MGMLVRQLVWSKIVDLSDEALSMKDSLGPAATLTPEAKDTMAS